MNHLTKLCIIGYVAVALFGSCVKTKIVTMNVMRPADIALSYKIKSIVLVDRTKDKKAVNVIEGILTGEMPEEDKAAVQRLMSSLQAELQRSPRFRPVTATERLSGNSLTAAFPQPLSWEQVDELCSKYDAQAVVAIEVFDSDFIITNGKRKTKKTTGEGDNKKEIEVDEYVAEGVANIKAGIRLYDQVNKNIVDEQLMSGTNTWKTAAASKAEALAKLIDKRDATIRLGEGIGSDYAFKIAPLPIRISRTFYKKSRKSPEIERGTRQADVNKWHEAIETWKSGVPTARDKQAGFLMYNVAIGYEVVGDYDTAIQWAQDSYTRFGNKKAREYAGTLQSRKRSEAKANEQMRE